MLGRTSHFLFLGRTSYILRTFNKSISLLGGTSKKNILYNCWILTLELSCYVIEGDFFKMAPLVQYQNEKRSMSQPEVLLYMKDFMEEQIWLAL